MEMKGLSSEEIQALLAGSRQRNQYGPKLLEFLESDEAAINPADVWPEFADKQTTTLYQGFNKAIKDNDLLETVSIAQMNGSLFLLHKDKVALALSEAVAA